ncbi:Lysophospholipase L1 [Frankineae bacterium MT45]|nr:Lysophospholipase L1 [Frankineae bacterium MT45]
MSRPKLGANPRVVPGAVAILVALTGMLAGCSSNSSNPSKVSNSSQASQPGSWSVVALGDSVPAGANCHCTPYPELTASGLTKTTGQTVTATNDAAGGYTTSDVLHQLQSDNTVIGHVRTAHVIEVEIGANDVAHSRSCGTTVECYAPALPALQTNLDAIVARLRELTSGHKALVVLLDYWSVWLGGKYAADEGEAYVATATQVTDDVDTIIKTTAGKVGAAYVDLRAAFKGPNYAHDETQYLSNDGDHPNAAGHEQIAAATQTVIERALHP